MDNYIVKNSLVQSLTDFIPKTSIPVLDVIIYTILTGFIFRIFTYVTSAENLKEYLPESKNPINWFLQRNVVTITHMIDLDERDDFDDDDCDKNLNNLIVIRAVRMLAKGGKSYKLRNISETDDYTNEYESEIKKVLQLQLDDTVYDEGIEISYWETTKKHKRKVGTEYIEVDKRDTLTLELSSRKKTINEIKEYIQRKRDEYINLNCAHEKHPKVWYPSEYTEHKIAYHPYKFVGTKNWSSYFLPNKEQIKGIVDNFHNKTGMYRVPGVQHKLGMLLHGIPGSGKTSLIKLLANYLDRHVIVINLGNVKSARSLMKVFHDPFLNNEDEGTWEYVPLNKRIIVFEEIDTAGSVVMDRERLEKTKEQDEAKFKEMFGRYEFFDMMYMASDRWKGMNPTKSTSDEQAKGDKCPNINSLNGENCVNEDGDEEEKSYKIPKFRGENAKDFAWKTLKENEKFTLGDILNLFDGLLELDGLIYIMTTNHRDFLDDALTRPGRVNIDIRFEEMKYQEIKELLNFYYVKYSNEAESMFESLRDSANTLTREEKEMMIEEIAKKADGKFKASKLEVMCQTKTIQSVYEEIINM